MTVIGIGGCMGLIVVGFGLQDSITAIAKNQFVNLFTYQASAVFNGDATEEKKAQVQSEMETYPGDTADSGDVLPECGTAVAEAQCGCGDGSTERSDLFWRFL